MSGLKVIRTGELSLAIASGAVLVDFGAPWCGPCKAMEPLLVDLARELEGRLSVLKVDIDAAPDIAEACGVMSVPTLMLFKDGKKVDGRTGSLSTKQLQAFVQPVL